MPELPEVEFARRGLTEWLLGRTVARVRVADERALGRGRTEEEVAAALEGGTVTDVARRGKWLRFALDSGELVFSHLGMTGKWVARPTDAPPERFEKIRFDLVEGAAANAKDAKNAKNAVRAAGAGAKKSAGAGRKKKQKPHETGATSSVRYRDPRLLGQFIVTRSDIATWRSLGPDPLLDGVDVERLAARLAKRSLSIKQVLLDQKVLAGIGNIQATEALFIARIHPERLANDLSAKEVKALARAITASIDRTLALEAGPEITYVEESRAKNPFPIYGHGGEPCPRCKAPLTRIVHGGRGTVFCARCQT